MMWYVHERRPTIFDGQQLELFIKSALSSILHFFFFFPGKTLSVSCRPTGVQHDAGCGQLSTPEMLARGLVQICHSFTSDCSLGSCIKRGLIVIAVCYKELALHRQERSSS